MKRALAPLLFGLAVLWAVALFDVRGASPPALAPKSPADVEAASPASEPRADSPARSRSTEGPAEVPASHTARAPEGSVKASATSTLARTAKSGAALIGKVARSLLRGEGAEKAQQPVRTRKPAPEGTGEIGAGASSPEYVDYEQRYAREVRDGDWAPGHEQRVLGLLQTQPWADTVGLVHCEQTLCRIVIESDIEAKDTFERLISVPGLSEFTGIRAGTPYSLRSGQLSVYFRGRDSAPGL